MRIRFKFIFRQTSATDAVGTTTFIYDAFDQLTAEQVNGLYSKTLTRYYDPFGRNVGYSVEGDRKQSITYASTTGRIAEADGFRWEYLAGTNLKSSFIYPNDVVVTWTYEPHRDLLTAVTNATYSIYVYTNDLLGRRTSKNNEQYGYNVRDELTSANDTSYAYDDIGNRTTAEGKTYTANNLNQYTAIDDFTPQYDADGNQTLIQTSTGIWSVVYNAENRPIRWQSGDTVITMSFDRMGRRVEMRTVKDGAETLQRFVYDNYLCIQQLRTPSNTLFHSYTWDPTEPIATRPLIFRPSTGALSYYFHDGNKNVSDLVDITGNIVHYAYAPFGTPTASASSENPYTFSSEVHDNTLGLVYYNYRHYTTKDGRWVGYDKVEPFPNPYLFFVCGIDYLGMTPLSITLTGKNDGESSSIGIGITIGAPNNTKDTFVLPLKTYDCPGVPSVEDVAQRMAKPFTGKDLCGSGITEVLVPDSLPGVDLKKGKAVLVDISECCQKHDDAYANATLWGFFSDKPMADCKLRNCIKEKFREAIEGAGGTILGEGFGDAYFLGVTVGGGIPWILEAVK